jgi:hypothetical protein
MKLVNRIFEGTRNIMIAGSRANLTSAASDPLSNIPGGVIAPMLRGLMLPFTFSAVSTSPGDSALVGQDGQVGTSHLIIDGIREIDGRWTLAREVLALLGTTPANSQFSDWRHIYNIASAGKNMGPTGIPNSLQKGRPLGTIEVTAPIAADFGTTTQLASLTQLVYKTDNCWFMVPDGYQLSIDRLAVMGNPNSQYGLGIAFFDEGVDRRFFYNQAIFRQSVSGAAPQTGFDSFNKTKFVIPPRTIVYGFAHIATGSIMTQMYIEGTLMPSQMGPGANINDLIPA